MSEFLLTGRSIFLFTRPDGRIIVEKPDCCRRIFPETENINRRRTFSKNKTAPASEIAWVKFQQRKSAQKGAEPEDASLVCHNAQETLHDIDDFLKTLNQG